MIYYVNTTKQEKEEQIKKENTVSVGMAAIGGPWELVNQDGVTLTQDDFKGQVRLSYNLFCWCLYSFMLAQTSQLFLSKQSEM